MAWSYAVTQTRTVTARERDATSPPQNASRTCMSAVRHRASRMPRQQSAGGQDQCVIDSASSCLPCSDAAGWTSHPTSRPTFFTNLSHHRLPSGHSTDSSALWLDRFFWASRFLFLASSLFFFVWFRAADLAGYMLLLGARKYHHIVSYRCELAQMRQRSPVEQKL